MRGLALATATLLCGSALASAQDQQLGARTKAMGGSYTAFEDDPVSVWLNPAGIATQPDQGSIAYHTYTAYPLHRSTSSSNGSVSTSAEPESTFADPVFIPSYLGFVFQVGSGDSPMAIGICYARPYLINYSFDQIDDPATTVFTPDSNVEETFHRFRVAFAKDFRLRAAGETGFLTRFSLGAGLDAGFERWQFRSAQQDVSDTSTTFGGGAGGLLVVYDNLESLRVNLGAAYQSALKWDFNINPDVLPAFDMPQQVNVGVTLYLLENMPLRATFDFQWVEWSGTAEGPAYAGKSKFVDAYNFSFGVEYRMPVSERVSLYPRLGFRRLDAPWSDKDNLPMTGTYKLVLDTKGASFNIVTFGVGISWKSEGGKIRSVDVAGDAGGDSSNFAVGFNFEF